jgi:hypothetical protein
LSASTVTAAIYVPSKRVRSRSASQAARAAARTAQGEYQLGHEEWTIRHHKKSGFDRHALMSAYGDAAHLGDAIAKDIANGRWPSKLLDAEVAAVTRAANAIWQLREKS